MNILSLVVVIGMHTCMYAKVCNVLVTASCVWNVNKYLVALQYVHVVDLIGQDVVLSGWCEQLGTLGTVASTLNLTCHISRQDTGTILCNI